MLEVLDLRHNPPVSSIFRWSQTEYALAKAGPKEVNLGYESLLLAVMGVLGSMLGHPSIMRGNRRKRLSELPPVVKRTLGRLPMLIAEANADHPDRIRQCWFSPAMLDGRLDPEGPTVATVAVLQSFVPRARGPDGEWARAIVNQNSVVSIFSRLDDEEGGDYYNNLLDEHLPPGHYFWHDAPGLAHMQSFQAHNFKQEQINREQIAARNNRLGLRPCALPGCSAKEQFAKSFKVCSRCLAAAYCCAEHQAEHWKGHKKACKTPAQ